MLQRDVAAEGILPQSVGKPLEVVRDVAITQILLLATSP